MIDLYKKPLSNLWAALLPALYLALVVVIDHYTPESTITPSLCTFGMLLIAISFTVRWVTFWSLFYSAVVYSVFHVPCFYAFFNSGMTLPHDLSFNIRSIAFLIVGIFSICFSILLKKFRQISFDQDQIISHIPDPLVTSDADGKILFANSTLLEKIGLQSEQLTGLSFFDQFAPEGALGITAADYFYRFEEQRNSKPFQLKIGNKNYLGDTVKLTAKDRPVLLTIFRDPAL